MKKVTIVIGVKVRVSDKHPGSELPIFETGR